jgi:hypothetical protein
MRLQVSTPHSLHIDLRVLTQCRIVVIVGVVILGLLFGLLIWHITRTCVFGKPFCVCGRKKKVNEDEEIGVNSQSEAEQ